MVELHPEDTEFDLEGDPALAALLGGEGRPIIGEHPGRDSPGFERFPEAGDHIRTGCVAAGVAAQA
jgi:hypothetical protein